MKKKLFSYLMLAFAIMGAGLVGSCNDYCEDLYDEYRLNSEREDSTLSKLIQKNIQDIKDLQNKFKICQDSCRARWSRLSDSIKVLQDSATNGHTRIYTEIAALQAQDEMLGKAIDSVKNVLDTLGNCIGEGGDPKTALVYLFTTATQAKADAAAAMAKADRDSIAIENIKFMWSDSLAQVFEAAAKANALAEKDSIWISDLKAYVDSMDSSLKAYVDSVDATLQDSIDAVAAIAKENLQKAKEYAYQQDSILQQSMCTRMDSIKQVLEMADSLMQDSIDSLAVRVKKNTERIEALEDTITSIIERMNILSDSVKVLDERVDSLFDAEKKRITSLLVQGTINPAFGSFSLPVGIRSNILMGYYGQFDTDIEFPTTSTAHMVNPATALTARDAELIGLSGVKQTLSADALNADTLSAGKLYFTVNPNEVVLDSTYQFSFVNSVGDTCAAKIGEITASTEKLTFGFSTRSSVSSPSGFYEAPVYFFNDDAASLAPNIDKDALKNIAKDVLSWRDGIDLGSAATTVVRAFNGFLDANALNVTWTDSLGTHNVKSQYEVAVAAVRPLSYNTLADYSISRSLPTLPDLSGISVNVDTLEFTPMTFTINNVPTIANVHSIVITDTDVEVVVTIGGTDYIGHAYNNFSTLTTAIDAAVEDNIEEVVAQINTFVAEMRSQVNSITSELNGVFLDVNDMIRDTENSINSSVNSYISKANNYISKINTWINRLNNKIHSLSPDVLLQPTILYEGTDKNFHQMSGSSVLPSNFTGFSAGSVIRLNLTSYSAELLAPAYKKHVAVTNVISLSDGTDAQGGNATCTSVLTSTNAGDFNQILDGETTQVFFKPAAAGYIYEIALSAIDYNGWISTRKFYVTVK